MDKNIHSYYRFKKRVILIVLSILWALIGIIMGYITFFKEKYFVFIFFGFSFILSLTFLFILINRSNELEINFNLKEIHCLIRYKKQNNWNIHFQQLQKIDEKNGKLFLCCENQKEIVIPLKLFSKKQIQIIKEDLKQVLWVNNYDR